jgi:hypothetical protein
METMRLNTVIKKDGEITMTGLPYKKGQRVEMILLAPSRPKRALSARELRHSALIGLWKNRTDIQDNVTFARQLRNHAQRRAK